MAVTHLTTASDTRNVDIYSTASVTADANKLVCCFVASSDITTGGVADEPTVSGLGLTWQKVIGVTHNADTRRATLFVARTGASAATGSITFTFPGAESGCNWSVFQMDADLTGADALASIARRGDGSLRAATAVDAGTTLTVTLLDVPDAANTVVAGFSHRAQSTIYTPGVGFTSIANTSHGSPVNELSTEFDEAGADTTADFSWDVTGGCGGIAVEIKAPPSTATPITVVAATPILSLVLGAPAGAVGGVATTVATPALGLAAPAAGHVVGPVAQSAASLGLALAGQPATPSVGSVVASAGSLSLPIVSVAPQSVVGAVVAPAGVPVLVLSPLAAGHAVGGVGATPGSLLLALAPVTALTVLSGGPITVVANTLVLALSLQAPSVVVGAVVQPAGTLRLVLLPVVALLTETPATTGQVVTAATLLLSFGAVPAKAFVAVPMDVPGGVLYVPLDVATPGAPVATDVVASGVPVLMEP